MSKNKKNPSKPEPDGLKPNALKWKKKLQVEKQKKIHESLNPTALNQRQYKWKKKLQVEKQKNRSKPEPDRLKPTPIK